MSDLRLVRKYFYGVIDCSREGALGITGIDDRAVCCTPWHDIGAAVSEFPRDRCSANVSAIARHELVIETLMKTHSLLPARFGTILSEAAQVTELLSANYEGFLRDLERLRNKVEFGLKVLWPAGELRILIERSEPGLSPPATARPAPAPAMPSSSGARAPSSWPWHTVPRETSPKSSAPCSSSAAKAAARCCRRKG